MRYIADDAVAAHEGLAGDEFLMSYYGAKNPSREPTLRLYTYRSHCALVGRFQNIDAELDLDACRDEGVPFTRRPTGGGAILMGENQLGLAFTAAASDWKEVRMLDLYRRLAAPIIHAMGKLGIHARFRPKNDLEVQGRKIAGLGLYFDAFGAMLFHTSLLVDLDVPLMLRVLKIPVEKISDKSGVSSIEDRITTVSRELRQSVSTRELRELVKQSFEEAIDVRMEARSWAAGEWEQIEQLAKQKYCNEEWIFQRTPQPEQTGMGIIKSRVGLIRAYLGLKGDVIKSVLITGDFFEATETLNRMESQLKWSPLDKENITRLIRNSFRDAKNQTGLAVEDLVEVIWKAGLNARAKNRFTNGGSCYYPKEQRKDYAPAG